MSNNNDGVTVPDPEVVGAMAEEARIWADEHPDHTLDEYMEWCRSKGWLDDREELALKQSLEDAIWYGLDEEQGAPHSGVDMTIVVDEVIKYLAHRGYEIRATRSDDPAFALRSLVADWRGCVKIPKPASELTFEGAFAVAVMGCARELEQLIEALYGLRAETYQFDTEAHTATHVGPDGKVWHLRGGKT